MRIVTLLPSATDWVVALGLTERLVGVSHECDGLPATAASQGIVAVTRSRLPGEATSRAIDAAVREWTSKSVALYELDSDRLAELRPDVIVTQRLCGVCAVADHQVHAVVEDLHPRPRVVTLGASCLEGVFADLERLAEVTESESAGRSLSEALNDRIERVRRDNRSLVARPRVAVLEWLDPLFSSGHWGPELVELAGGIEGLGIAGERSRVVAWDELIAWQPEILVLACCGFGFDRTLAELPALAARPGWQSLPCVRDDRVFVADGAGYFNRPGPRLIPTLEALATALHPDRHPEVPTRPQVLRPAPLATFRPA